MSVSFRGTVAGPPSAGRAVEGVLRTRLLVNAVVDPDEAAVRLPDGLRPHVTAAGTVVGCCLLDVARLRPAGLPARVGVGMRAAAHRISVEWAAPSGERVVGVYVPARLTDSALAIALGGRWFPGVHHRARLATDGGGDRLSWRVDGTGAMADAHLHVVVRRRGDEPRHACEPVGGTCLAAAIGLSPGRGGVLEAARMAPRHRTAAEVDVEILESTFLAGFATARPAPAYVMDDVAVTWTPADPPAGRAPRAA